MFLSEVREGIERSTFEDQRKILDLLNVRGKLAIENAEIFFNPTNYKEVGLIHCKKGWFDSLLF